MRAAIAALLVIGAAVSASCAVLHLGRPAGDGGAAAHAMIDGPLSLAVIGQVLYVSEMEPSRIRRIDLTTGAITTLKTSRPLVGLGKLSADQSGRLVAVEFCRISRIDPRSGAVSTIAGTGTAGVTGDGGPATEARLWFPQGVTTDAPGNILIADSAASRIRRVDAHTGNISTFAGTGSNETSGDQGPADRASFEFPNSVAVDEVGDVYVAQYGYDPSSHRIRRIDAASGVVSTVAGPDTTVWLTELDHRKGIQRPSDLTFDRNGGLLFTDPVAGLILRLDMSKGDVRVVAGGGSNSADGPVAGVQLLNPCALAVTPGGQILVAEYEGNRVRRVDVLAGMVTTLGGNGKPKRTTIFL